MVLNTFKDLLIYLKFQNKNIKIIVYKIYKIIKSNILSKHFQNFLLITILYFNFPSS